MLSTHQKHIEEKAKKKYSHVSPNWSVPTDSQYRLQEVVKTQSISNWSVPTGSQCHQGKLRHRKTAARHMGQFYYQNGAANGN